MPLLWRPHADRRSLPARRHTARPALRCRERELSDDCPGRLVAPSIRRNFLFPARCPFYSRTGKRRHDTVDHYSIVPSAALADPVPPSLAASSSHQSAQNDLPPAPPRDQIPIAGQLFAAVPRVRSSEAFGRRPAGTLTGSNARAKPASETLTDLGHGSGTKFRQEMSGYKSLDLVASGSALLRSMSLLEGKRPVLAVISGRLRCAVAEMPKASAHRCD